MAFKFKAIAMDIDGTLLNSDGKMSKKTKDALLLAQSKGVKLILSTGRPANITYEIANELEMDKKEHEGYLLTDNGALLKSAVDHKIIFEDKISVDLAKHILGVIEKYPGLYPFYMDDGHIYVHDAYEAIVDSRGNGNEDEIINMHKLQARAGNYLLQEVKRMKDFVSKPIFKMHTSNQPDYIKKHLEDIKRDMGDQVEVLATYPAVTEFNKKGISKGKSLSKLGINMEDIIAFGDSVNDIDMLKSVGCGVAMGNALEEVKEIADEITESNDNDGIYYSLKKHGLFD